MPRRPIRSSSTDESGPSISSSSSTRPRPHRMFVDFDSPPVMPRRVNVEYVNNVICDSINFRLGDSIEIVTHGDSDYDEIEGVRGEIIQIRVREEVEISIRGDWENGMDGWYELSHIRKINPFRKKRKRKNLYIENLLCSRGK